MSSMQIQQVLAEMRSLQARASGVAQPPAAGAQPSDFASLMKNSVDRIATMQNQAIALSDAYEAGDKSVEAFFSQRGSRSCRTNGRESHAKPAFLMPA